MKEIEFNKDIFESITRYLKDWLIDSGISESLSKTIADYSGFLLVIAIAMIAFYISKFIILRWVQKLAKKSASNWDDIFVERKVFKRLAYLVPALIILQGSRYVIPDYPITLAVVLILIKAYIVTVTMIVLRSVLDSANDIYNSYEISKSRPIKGFIQVAKIFIFIVYAIILITILFLRSRGFEWIAGLGAFSAVLLLIFKDPILGFAGGIQLAMNDMLRIGDWIEMPKYNADGVVMDIGITTVKVQNWDKTITTIPTYYFVSDSYKNWRGMQESGARRIRRHILIDLNSIKFCTTEMLENYAKYEYVADYVKLTEEELDIYNEEKKVDPGVMINGHRQTNIGVFRAYLTSYLKNNPNLHQDLSLMVRQLQPTESGLPLEIYAFSKEQEWEKFESIQSDIFDHILAGIKFFDLKLFQSPSGIDFQALANISENEQSILQGGAKV
jgi:miniconductance mechanosensitive channel